MAPIHILYSRHQVELGQARLAILEYALPFIILEAKYNIIYTFEDHQDIIMWHSHTHN